MKNPLDLLLVRDNHVCPWWCCFTFDNIFRRLVHDPRKLLSPYILPGSTVLDIGPGQGYFTLPMAEMAGENGKVLALDVQNRMLDAIVQRAKKRGLDSRIVTKLVTPDNPDIGLGIDFALAFWMVHEVPDKPAFFKQIYAALKPGKALLMAEPGLHVTGKMMAVTVKTAEQAGFTITARPRIFFSRAVLLQKPGL